MVYFVNNINDIFDEFEEEEYMVSGAIIFYEGKFLLIHLEKAVGTYVTFHEAAVEAFGKGIDPEYYSSPEEYFACCSKRQSA